MEFEERLQKAIHRGEKRSDEKSRAEAEKAFSEGELRRLHSEYRLTLSDRIEEYVERLGTHFPGFDFTTLFGDRGWGAAVSRDDILMNSGKRSNQFSRLEMTIRPFSSLFVLELTAKGTIRNREVFTRSHFEKLEDADQDNFIELIDHWVLEYAELFAAK